MIFDLFGSSAGIAIKESAKVGDQAQRRMMRGVDDLDFFIGDDAIDKPSYATKVECGASAGFDPGFARALTFVLPLPVQWPIRHGIVEDWDLMERFMEQIIFKYLRAEPEDHYFLLVRTQLEPGLEASALRQSDVWGLKRASVLRRSLRSTRRRTGSTQRRSCSSPSTSRVSTSPFRYVSSA